MRSTDNHFYWIGIDRIGDKFQIDNLRAGGVITPATILGDIGGNNVINISKCLGVQRFSIWLSQEMIDWSKPVAVNVNSSTARDANTGKDWRSKVLEPDIETLLADYRERGDRRMLFLRRLEFMGPP